MFEYLITELPVGEASRSRFYLRYLCCDCIHWAHCGVTNGRAALLRYGFKHGWSGWPGGSYLCVLPVRTLFCDCGCV